MRALVKITAVLGLPLLTVGLVGLVPVAARAEGPPAPPTFAFTGGGWGHGIGMSQYGALGMATEGVSATKILEHYYTGTTVGSYADDVSLRVNLAHRVTGIKLRTDALAAGGGGISVNLGASKVYGKAGDVWGLAVSGTKLQVKKNGTAQGAAVASVVVKWSGTRHPVVTSGDDTKAAALDVASSTAKLATTGHRYRYGYVKVVARAVGGVTRLEVVNVLTLHDEYLRGVAEVPSSWPAQALQAQAIASRSYALVKYAAGVRADCQCHVYSSVSDQNFLGYVKETSAYGAAWRGAVTATGSRTVLYAGKPAQAFYSSSTGGRTQNVQDVWGGNVPYLKSVDDHWSTEAKYNPNATWGPLVRSQAQVAKAFGLPDVARVDLSSRYVSTALKAATAWSSAGASVTLPVGTFVSRLSLTSNWVRTVTPPGVVTKPGLLPFPLAQKNASAKKRYFGYRAAHPKMARSRVVDGGVATARYKGDVLRLQNWLKKLGYLKVAPNGHFGPSTHAAVRAFQKAQHVKATGLVGGGPHNTTGSWRLLQVKAAKHG